LSEKNTVGEGGGTTKNKEFKRIKGEDEPLAQKVGRPRSSGGSGRGRGCRGVKTRVKKNRRGLLRGTSPK